jgi:ABC-type nitrate/sulfonate/bicarbonate transport system substrate-binding protein
VAVAHGSAAGEAGVVWVAIEKGYFQEYGLQVESLYTQTVAGIQSLIAGENQFGQTGCSDIMTSRRGGSDLTILADTNPRNLYLIASQPTITEPQQLIGKTVAVNKLNDTSHLSARFALQEAGVDPDAVSYLQVGSTPERFAALHAGGVDAAIQSISTLREIRALGMTVLINLFERGIPYCGAGIGASDAWMRAHPQTVEAFVRGFVRGNAYLREGDSDQVKAIMAKYMRLEPSDPILTGAYEALAKQILPREPFVSRDGIAFVLNEQARSDPSWLEWQPEQFYDSTVMQKLQREGYFEAVYQQLR